MKNIIKNILFFTIIIFIIIYLFQYNYYIKEQVLTSYHIWLKKIIPVLFPLFILSDILKNSSIPKTFEKLFHIPFIYLFSIIFGSPSNAYIIKDYKEDLTKYLAVTKYPSLLFTYTYLKAILNNHLAIILILTNILSNIILIALIKPKKNVISYNNEKIIPNIPKYINNSLNTNLSILGTIIFFQILPFNLINNIYLKSFILSILEITSSFENLATNLLPIYLKFLFSIITLLTCGQCIETQIRNIIPSNLIDTKKYLSYRMIHHTIYLSIILLFLVFFY